MVTCLRGLEETGRPPFDLLARSSISSVSSGRSLYSRALMMCASTLLKSDFKEQDDARFLTGIGFPHAEYVTGSSARGITDNHQAARQIAEADDSDFTVISAAILNLQGRPLEHMHSVPEIQTSLRQRRASLGWIEGYAHVLL